MKKSLGHEVVDQAAHFIAGFACAFIVDAPHIWQGGFLGLSLGLTREVTEGGNIVSAGSLRDMFFWTLGGVCGTISRKATNL